MAEVIFNLEGINTNIQCKINDKMADIIDKFLIKVEQQKKKNQFYYLYNGTQIKQSLTFNEQANDLDKNRKKMNVIVNLNDGKKNENYEVTSKEVICPKCKENAIIDIKNFKINFFGCKNKHKVNDILLNEYKGTQKIDLSKIICNICNRNNKYNTHNNEFYICNTCNKNICPLCKSVHEKSHMIINYEDKNYICKKHNDSFIKFCKKCNENMCIICQNEHKTYDIFDLSSILLKKDDLLKIKDDLKNVIDKFKYKINVIKEIFDKTLNLLDIYYNVNNDIINNYNINKRNYYELQNLYKLKLNNEKLIKELKNLINNDVYSELFEFSFNNFYNDNGEKYIGELKEGLKNGKGVLFYEKNNEFKRIKYEGDFENNMMHGKGIMYWINGNRYEGEYKKGRVEGKGIMYYSDGEKYEGDWKFGRREGKGIMYYKNGNRYEGDFNNGVREGRGIIYYKNGNRFESNWKDDKSEGKGTLYFKNGKIKECVFKEDKYNDL